MTACHPTNSSAPALLGLALQPLDRSPQIGEALGSALALLRRDLLDLVAQLLDAGKIEDKWRQTRGRRFVNYARAVLSILCAHAVELGIIPANPVQGVKQVRKDRDAAPVNRPWTLSERQVAIQNLPPHLRLPLVIALFSGMSEGDNIRQPPTVVQNGCIKIRTRKRGVWIDIPVLPMLAKTLAEAKIHIAGKEHDAITLCTNSRGKPWTLNGFSCSFRKALKVLNEKGLVGDRLTFHGLRHTVATVLAEAGVTAEDIAAVLGQCTSQMADHYSREADRSRRTKAAIKKFKPLGNARNA